ncbi:MAG: hypothetical protein A3J28_04570 [Acidobacteria bacterium RIFCSPLOWO2_12_FULL_60_22]|nr:MAG: hypothetical protein A3J28_04570 [Acidobacteria bacterium RIFCSPLOWO2_12_FULL_60_22]
MRLLIAEDSPADAELNVAMLKRAGYSLSYDLADSPSVFEQRLAQNQYNLILSDHNMGNWIGTDALDILRQSGKDVPFIVVTATLGDEAAVEYVKSGATDYVLKHRLQRLPIAVGRALREKAHREETARLQEEVLCAKRDWELTFDSVPDLVLILDPEGIVQRANRVVADTVGLDFSQIVGRHCYEVVHGMSEACQDCPHHRSLESGQTERGDLEEPRLGKVFDAFCTPLRHPDGTVQGSVVALRDITERKQLEKQLFQTQRLEAIGRLAGGIAHDFNNILGIVTGYSDLVLERLEPESPLRSKIEQIRKAGERGIALTRQLLAFGRQQVLEPMVLNLNDWVSDTMNMLEQSLGEDIEIATVLNPELGAVKADPAQMEQIIMNLAINARDAMPTGGKLTIETANAELDEKYAQQRHVVAQPGPYVMLAVSDTGIGMDADLLSRIFEPFFTTKDKFKGTGLGLSTVYGIVKQSGGYVWVYSELNKGTTFKIYLPRVDQAAEEVRARAARAVPPQGTETILVLEDEASLRELVCEWLQGIGYTVLEAKSGADALAIAGKYNESIHLLLTDVVMPGMSGREAAERLASLCPKMNVLYISGYTDDAIVHHGILNPGVAFLQKPFTREALAQKVRGLLDQAAEPDRRTGSVRN